jgi:tRNA(Ile)-lysidine synthase
MLDQLLDFVNKQKLFQPGERMLLAVSGGIDSMVLLHLFQQTDFDFAVAHCNFQLRESESDGDETFVRQMAGQIQRPLFVKTFDTEVYSENNGISIQMAARDLRRAWFDELLLGTKYEKIATAHHLNDSLETAIFNLARGTGIAGLHGILPKKANYIRPLLFATRDMIAQYAAANNVEWREDRTNISTKYSRNLIRHQVIPELKKINPNLEFTFAQTSEKIAATANIFQETVSGKKSFLFQEIDGMIGIEKKKLSELPEPHLMLFELLKEYGFNYQQVRDMLVSIDHESGKVFCSETHQITMDRERIFLDKIRSREQHEKWIMRDSKAISVASRMLVFDVLDAAETSISDDPNLALLDLERLHFPLKARHWQHGDSFYPLGMKHKKKVSDFMIDEKIPVNLKNQIIAIFSGENLVWIVGHRIDDRYKITKQTRKIFRIYNENS